MAFVNLVEPASTRPLSQHSKTTDLGQTAFGRFMSVLENGVSYPHTLLPPAMYRAGRTSF